MLGISLKCDKMTTPSLQSHRIPSSIAFLRRPFFRFKNATYLVHGPRQTQKQDGVRERERAWNSATSNMNHSATLCCTRLTCPFRSSSMRWILIAHLCIVLRYAVTIVAHYTQTVYCCHISAVGRAQPARLRHSSRALA